jgi:hypothetical protein
MQWHQKRLIARPLVFFFIIIMRIYSHDSMVPHIGFIFGYILQGMYIWSLLSTAQTIDPPPWSHRGSKMRFLPKKMKSFRSDWARKIDKPLRAGFLHICGGSPSRTFQPSSVSYTHTGRSFWPAVIYYFFPSWSWCLYRWATENGRARSPRSLVWDEDEILDRRSTSLSSFFPTALIYCSTDV